jgi:hypothetical protein
MRHSDCYGNLPQTAAEYRYKVLKLAVGFDSLPNDQLFITNGPNIYSHPSQRSFNKSFHDLISYRFAQAFIIAPAGSMSADFIEKCDSLYALLEQLSDLSSKTIQPI